MAAESAGTWTRIARVDWLVIVLMSAMTVGPPSVWVIRLLAVTFAVCSLLSLIGARARHFSRWVFLIIATLLWIGA
jgi:hypothetical protein